MANVGKIVSAVAKAAAKKKAAAANAKGLKAANKGSKAPKGYKPDTAGRASVMDKAAREQSERYSSVSNLLVPGKSRKAAFRSAALDVDSARRMAANAGDVAKAAPKNVISRSGKVANTKKLTKKSLKK
jgi:hypothetical protein